MLVSVASSLRAMAVMTASSRSPADNTITLSSAAIWGTIDTPQAPGRQSFINARGSPVRWLRTASVVLAVLAILVPWGLETAGVIEPSYSFEDGALVVRSHLSPSLPPGPTTALLLLTSLGLVLLPVLFVGQSGRSLAAAERRLALHAWHMRQLVTDEQRGESA